MTMNRETQRSRVTLRHRPAHAGVALAAAAAFGLLASIAATAADVPDPAELRKMALEAIQPIPATMPGAENDTPEMIELGRELYFEKALSENRTQSCNDCHRVDQHFAGVDNEPTSPGAFGKRGDRNSPTVLNAGFQFAQFWDGRAEDLVEQAKGPVLNPVEMAMPDEVTVVRRLKEITRYEPMFRAAFPKDEDPINYDNTARAIAAFERTLVTRDRVDDFLNGDDNALTPTELKGMHEFLTLGCTTCHYGPVLGGQTFQKVGLIHPFPTEDLGRFTVTQEEGDEYRFKVPMLRNVALTYPYFHAGQVSTLEEAVRKMGWHQLGQDLTEEQVRNITAFLSALTDKPREHAVKSRPGSGATSGQP